MSVHTKPPVPTAPPDPSAALAQAVAEVYAATAQAMATAALQAVEAQRADSAALQAATTAGVAQVLGAKGGQP